MTSLPSHSLLLYFFLLHAVIRIHSQSALSIDNQAIVNSPSDITNEMNRPLVVGTGVGAYCSFFGNRAPKPQPNLGNCTWYRERSCCMEQELKITFAKMKPMQGASPSCIQYLNLLMCYICAPNQHMFYSEESLKVCIEFCDAWYMACREAILKGSVIRELYKNGQEFCASRSFHVVTDGEPGAGTRHCFDYRLHAGLFSGSPRLLTSTKNEPLTLATMLTLASTLLSL